jgi:hypothetical protein
MPGANTPPLAAERMRCERADADDANVHGGG